MQIEATATATAVSNVVIFVSELNFSFIALS
jgi:hypothetical protein